MLSKFAVTNFRGFADRIEWDLSTPSSYEFNTFAIKEGIVKNGIIYGPNGSGKTNFGLAVFDIENHLSTKWKKPDYYSNFANAGSPEKPVCFEYTFKFGDKVLNYTYAKNNSGRLLRERLEVDGKMVFSCEGSDIEIDSEEFAVTPEMVESLRQSANQISIANFLIVTYPLPKDHYLLQLKKFTDTMLWYRFVDSKDFIGLENGVYLLDEDIISKGNIKDFEEFLHRVSGQRFSLAAHASGKKILCDIGGSQVEFQEIASTGTKSLQLFYFWFQRLREASFVFIDEFDAFYHFELSYNICKELFGLDCQAFTSSHNTFLLTNDLLRPDCNFILDKGVISPVCACTPKELRAAHNIEKIYRAGAFEVIKS